MGAGLTTPAWRDLDPFVEVYEKCLVHDGQANLADYLPAPDHPFYRAVLRELVRADLEHHWGSGRPTRVEDYLTRFPDLRQDLESLREIAFEEYRLRRQAGENVPAAEYRDRFGIDPADWPVLPVSACPATTLPPPGLEEAATVYLEQRAKAAENQSGAELEAALSSLPGAQPSAALLLDLHRTDPQEAYRLAQALTTMPAEGLDLLGFHLVKELGRGAFSRVYLATQGDLAGRPVAVKLTSEPGLEARTLARLQHTNIVPIYSVHRANSFQALCMPYFGATTLADVLRARRQLGSPPTSARWLAELLHGHSPPAHPVTTLADLTYADAVLWLACQLADGLAHAHERGILHQDLKPANVLLSDEGRPMLLDFNLAQDTRLRASVAAAYLGGTLPYMAPEHLEAFRDGRSQTDVGGDLYALGLILYELLTGRYPFPLPAGATAEELSRLIASRAGPPPSVRHWNPAVSPAFEAIVRCCLEPDPARRYSSARDLQDDLERQRANLPLRHTPEPSVRERGRKWVRRHPRLTSSFGVGAVAALLLLGLGGLYVWSQHRLAQSEARLTLRQFQEEAQMARFLLSGLTWPQGGDPAEGTAQAERALARYGVLGDNDWHANPAFALLAPEERGQLSDDLGELLLLLARAQRLQAESGAAAERRADQLRAALRLNERAADCFRDGTSQRAVGLQRALLLQEAGQEAAAREQLAQAAALPLRSARDYYLAAVMILGKPDYRQALEWLQEARKREPQDAYVHYALGLCHLGLGDPVQAVARFDTSLTLWPEFYGSYYHRGRAYLEQKDYEHARADFTEALRRRPDFYPACIDRALALAGLKDLAGAIADVTHVLDSGEAPTRLYFMRAEFRDQAGDRQGARRDRAEGLRLRPTDELSWVVRGVAHLPSDPKGALADFEEALRLNPRSRPALEDKAHVLAEYLGKTAEAVAVLDRAVALHPDYVAARAGRGVLLGRLKQRDAALRDAVEALRLDSGPATLYQVAGIYALTSVSHADDRREAFRLLAAALRGGYGLDLLVGDHDLDPIRKLPQFGRLVQAAQELQTLGATAEKKR
jgi:serine/threonine protein kinase/tetratricopeptide (TPR) repeat protein